LAQPGIERSGAWNVPQIRKLGGAAIRKTAELMIRQAPVLDFPGYLKLLAAAPRYCELVAEIYGTLSLDSYATVCREPAFELGP